MEQKTDENRKLKEYLKELNNDGQAVRNKLLDLTKEKCDPLTVFQRHCQKSNRNTRLSERNR